VLKRKKDRRFRSSRKYQLVVNRTLVTKNYINLTNKRNQDMTSCIDKIEPLTINKKEHIYVYNETNRKISRLDRIDKKLMKNKRKKN